METDRIGMETDSDIRFSVSFQFPSPRMETARKHMETDSDISDIHFYVFLMFSSLIACKSRHVGCVTAHASPTNTVLAPRARGRDVKPTGQAQRSLPASAARDESGMENFRTDRYRFPYYDTIPDRSLFRKIQKLSFTIKFIVVFHHI